MDLEVRIAALEDEMFHALLDCISPKGEDNQGTIQFQIRAAVVVPDDYALRAGYGTSPPEIDRHSDRFIKDTTGPFLHTGGSSNYYLLPGYSLFHQGRINRPAWS